MNRITTGFLLVIGVPVSYIAAIILQIIPPFSRPEAYGGCEPASESSNRLLLHNTTEICWDAVRYVANPVGVIAALIAIALFVLGVYIIVRQLLKRYA